APARARPLRAREGVGDRPACAPRAPGRDAEGARARAHRRGSQAPPRARGPRPRPRRRRARLVPGHRPVRGPAAGLRERGRARERHPRRRGRQGGVRGCRRVPAGLRGLAGVRPPAARGAAVPRRGSAGARSEDPRLRRRRRPHAPRARRGGAFRRPLGGRGARGGWLPGVTAGSCGHNGGRVRAYAQPAIARDVRPLAFIAQQRARLLVALTVGGYIGVLHAIGGHAKWTKVGVPVIPFWFGDLRNVTSAWECVRQHQAVLPANPCDPYHRPANYPRLWLLPSHLGLGQGDTYWLGWVVAVLFFVAAVAVVPRGASLRLGLLYAAALISAATMLGVERGNVDLLLF